MTTPQIPDHLLTYNPDDWPDPPANQSGMALPALVRREFWRRAQDRWGHEHGIWRAEFEELQAAQLAAQEPQP